MKTILTMPSPELALLTMTGEGKPFVLNRRTMAELEALLDEVRRRAPRALVLTGEGRFFCAGADIREMAAMDGRELYDWALLGSRLNTNLEELPMPVLAAVNGMALGGGCELALACDLRCASMAASFAVPEVTLGTICGAGGTQRLPRLIGETRAKEMIFTGREITAETAREWGLVNGVFTAGSLLEDAAVTVDGDGAHVPLHGEVALQLAGVALPALLHRLDRRLHDGAGGQRHQLGGVYIGDAVTQRAVLPGGRVVIGQRADAGHAVAYPRAQLPGTPCAGTGAGGQRQCGAAAADGEGRLLSGGLRQQGLHLLGGVDGGAVHGGDDVALPQAAGAGRRVAVRQTHHQHTGSKELDAHRLTQRDHGALRRGCRRRPRGLGAQREGEYRRQQPCGQAARCGDMPCFIQASHP